MIYFSSLLFLLYYVYAYEMSFPPMIYGRNNISPFQKINVLVYNKGLFEKETRFLYAKADMSNNKFWRIFLKKVLKIAYLGLLISIFIQSNID